MSLIHDHDMFRVGLVYVLTTQSSLRTNHTSSSLAYYASMLVPWPGIVTVLCFILELESKWR